MRLQDRFSRSKRTPSTRNQRIGFAFFWLLVLTFAYVIPDSPSFNTESHLYTTFAMVDHHTLSIDAYHRRLGDESFAAGHYYSDKAPGLSFLAVPVYTAFKLAFPVVRPEPYIAQGRHLYAIPRNTVYIRYAVTYLLVIVPSAIFAILLWLFLAQFAPSGWALILSAVCALGTIAFPYSMWFFSHQVTSVLLFGSFLLLFYRARGAPVTARTALWIGLAGVLAGYSVISEYPTVVIAFLIALYLMAVSPQRIRAGGAFAGGLVPPAALGVVYNLIAFGRPLATGYNYVHSSLYLNTVRGGALGLGGLGAYGVQAPTWHSLWSITLSPYRGLFFLSPVLLLFLPSIVLMWRRRDVRSEALLCLGVVVLYVLLDASRGQDLNGWSGGASVASRHLVPVLPFMITPMAFGLSKRSFRSLFVPLAALSVAVMSSIVAVGLSRGFTYSDPNPLFHEVWPAVAGGHIALDWGNLLGLQGPESLLPLGLGALALIARLVYLFRGGMSLRRTLLPVLDPTRA